MPFFAYLSSQTVVMHNEDCVVGVPNTERSETITHDGEEGNENVVDDIDNVELARAKVNPAFAN